MAQDRYPKDKRRNDYPGKRNDSKPGENKIEKLEITCDEIIKGKNFERLVDDANKMGKFMVDEKVKSTQFRRIFTHIKRIQTRLKKNENETDQRIPDEIMKEIYILKPKMAYTAGRHTNLEFLYKIMIDFINEIKTREHFDIFYHFIEATLAYHKFHGGAE